MPNSFIYAPEVKRIAEDLIATHHSHLAHIRIEYVFRSEPQKVNGQYAWATASKVTGRNAFFATPADEVPFELVADDETPPSYEFFVLDVHREAWLGLTPRQREALVDHELCHMGIELTDDGPKLILIGHDIEEFNSIVARHGNWNNRVKLFSEAVSGKANAAHADAAMAAAGVIGFSVIEGGNQEDQQAAACAAPAKKRGRPRKEAQQVAAP